MVLGHPATGLTAEVQFVSRRSEMPAASRKRNDNAAGAETYDIGLAVAVHVTEQTRVLILIRPAAGLRAKVT